MLLRGIRTRVDSCRTAMSLGARQLKYILMREVKAYEKEHNLPPLSRVRQQRTHWSAVMQASLRARALLLRPSWPYRPLSLNKPGSATYRIDLLGLLAFVLAPSNP